MFSPKELEIIKFTFERTPLSVYNECVNNYKTQYIYDRKHIIITNEFFNGNVLMYSVFMRNLFNKFITSTQEIRAMDINYELSQLSKKVNIAKKLKRHKEYSVLAKTYNALIVEHNQCTVGFKLMRKYFKKYKK